MCVVFVVASVHVEIVGAAMVHSAVTKEMDTMAIINTTDLKGKSQAELLVIITAMQEAANKPKSLSCKVTEKGGLSVYGLGRFPVTLYRGQWERLLGEVDMIKAFIEANKALLSVKE